MCETNWNVKCVESICVLKTNEATWKYKIIVGILFKKYW